MFQSGSKAIYLGQYDVTVVAYRPELGGHVVAMATGQDGIPAGEQWVAASGELS